MRIELDHLQITAPPECETAARSFFGGLLGMAEIAKPPELRRRGGIWFTLDDGRQLHVGVAPRSEFTASVKAHPGFRVEPQLLDDLAKRLVAAGYPVVWAHPDEIPELRRFHTTDPWGNRMELLSGVPAPPSG